MDNLPPNPTQIDKPVSPNNKLIITILPITLLILLVGIAIGRYVQGRELSQTEPIQRFNNESDGIEQASPLAEDVTGASKWLSIRTFPSYSGVYTFYVYQSESSDRCWFGIIDKTGIQNDFTKEIGTETLSCLHGQGMILSSFRGWGDEEQFLLEEVPGSIVIINIGTREKSTYQYDSSIYEFVTVDRSLQHWLFKKKNQTDNAYVLLNANQEIVLDNIPSGTSDRGPHYDSVNNGFLFIDRRYVAQEQGEGTVSIRFSYLPLDTLQLRQLLITDPVASEGRGCFPEYLIPTVGKIVITRDCLTVADKYVNENGFIEIDL